MGQDRKEVVMVSKASSQAGQIGDHALHVGEVFIESHMASMVAV